MYINPNPGNAIKVKAGAYNAIHSVQCTFSITKIIPFSSLCIEKNIINLCRRDRKPIFVILNVFPTVLCAKF
jgi:hypothetical protein